MIFSNKILVNEIAALRAENERLRASHFELIDKFVHNRVPERLVKESKPVDPMDFKESGMDDPVSVAERKAYEESKPKAQAYLNGTSTPSLSASGVLDEG